MARATPSQVSTVRRSSRIQQQMKPSPKKIASASTSSSTKRRISRIQRLVKTSSVASTKQQSRKPPRRKTSPPKTSATTPTTPFPFLNLPLEIRSMIYTLLISTGHLSIQRTSRSINQEAHSSFYRAAICRQKAGYIPSGQRFRYNDSSKLLFQNFELRCDLNTGPNPVKHRAIQTARIDRSVYFWSASDFGRSDIRRNRMVVEMRFNKMTPLWNAEESIEKYFDEPECFVGFRYLVVRVMSRPRRWSADELARIGKVVRDVLEPGLGPAVCEEWEEDGGGCIEYHPWSSAGQQSYRLEPVLYLKRAAWESHRRVGVRDEDDE